MLWITTIHFENIEVFHTHVTSMIDAAGISNHDHTNWKRTKKKKVRCACMKNYGTTC